MLAHEPLDLSHRLGGILDERVRPRARHQRPVRLIAPIRETLRDKSAAPGAQRFQTGAGKAEQNQPVCLGNSHDCARVGLLTARHVIQGTVRLEMPQRNPRACQTPQRADLIHALFISLLLRALQLAAAEVLTIGEAWMSARLHAVFFCQQERRVRGG